LTRRDSGRGGRSIFKFKRAIERRRRVENNAKLPKLVETWNVITIYFFSIGLGVRNYHTVLWLSAVAGLKDS
jgi:hypothetical protein